MLGFARFFNRLGGNSLAETVVAGMLIGKRVAEYAEKTPLVVHISLGESFAGKEREKIAHLLNNGGDENVYHLRDEISKALINDVGIFRNGERLENAVTKLRDVVKRGQRVKVRTLARWPEGADDPDFRSSR